MPEDSNQKLYRDRHIVQHYTQLKLLQPAEQTIIDLFHNQWSTMTLLDIGIGGGRTTHYFSQLVRSYMGIDYSEEMITACQKRFQNASEKITFRVCDARDMSCFEDHSFDFILFSFNGIDYMSHGDRLTILREIHRVGKPGGYFFFSSHNLDAIEREFNWKYQLRFNPIATYTNLIMFSLLRGFNSSITLQQLRKSSHAILKDESHNFRLTTYYIRPEEQIRQLESHFYDIQIYSWRSGQQLHAEGRSFSSTDMWLYYLCRIKEASELA